MNIARDHHNRIIHRFIELTKAIYVLYMHVHANDVVILQRNSIANNKSLVHKGKGFKLILFTTNSLSGTLHFRYGWDSRTKVMVCAARVMCAKEFVME